MMNVLRPDEMQVLKAQLIELDDDTVMLATFQYHTEKMDSIEGQKVDRSKSRYRWLARGFGKAEYRSEIQRLMQDDVRDSKFKWWNDPNWNGYITISDCDCATVARFMNMKLKKLRDWDIGQKLLDGWHSATKTKPEGYNHNARYETEGYTAPDGSIVSLRDRNALLKLKGANLWKEVQKKGA